MSILRVSDGPALGDLVAALAGGRLVKSAETPTVSYSLVGVLYVSRSGWLLLSVPNALARGVFAAMHEPGVELPPSEHGQGFNAHVSVMSPDEIEMAGGADKIVERGKQFSYTLGRLKETAPENWPGVSKVWYVVVHSPELQTLRRSYGLPAFPHGGDYDFHVTVAVRKRGVLGENEVKKESR